MPDQVPTRHQQRPIVLRSRQPVGGLPAASRLANTPFSDFVVAKPQPKARISSEALKHKPQVPQPVIDIIRPEPFAQPAAVRQQTSTVLQRQAVRRLPQPVRVEAGSPAKSQKHSRLQMGLVGMACLVFAVGLFASAQTILTNHTASAQVAALSKKVDRQAATQTSTSQSGTVVPSITKPSDEAVANYTVAPDSARYLNIPSLKIHARVQQVSAQKNGALGVPWNVFDAGWYTGSAKPGQPGATLIDGHVAAWTTHGVFYSIDKLVAGDQLQIVRGDGTIINYQVVRTEVYPAKHVDMHAALEPVVPGVSGLNLITCAGTAAAGTNNYSQRVVVFAKEIGS